MKAVLLILLALAAIAIVPSNAAAQQASALAVKLVPPTTPVTDDAGVTFNGTVQYTADYTAALALTGIPVAYTVTKMPAWANVIVSPATDEFPIPAAVPFGASFTVVREITVTVTSHSKLADDASDIIEITATTSPGPFGRSTEGKASVPILYKAAPKPADPCPFHANMTQAQMQTYAAEAAQAYDQYEASKSQQQPDVTTQTTAASPVPVPWIAVAGFAAAGAAVGFVLRRRLSK